MLGQEGWVGMGGAEGPARGRAGRGDQAIMWSSLTVASYPGEPGRQHGPQPSSTPSNARISTPPAQQRQLRSACRHHATHPPPPTPAHRDCLWQGPAADGEGAHPHQAVQPQLRHRGGGSRALVSHRSRDQGGGRAQGQICARRGAGAVQKGGRDDVGCCGLQQPGIGNADR